MRARRDAGLDRRGDSTRDPGASPSASRSTPPTTASATSGYVTGVATQVHGGRTLATYEIEITDEQDRRVCTARLTCMLRDI